ncbi:MULTISPECIES: hypothetical protein [unclassified Mesorhizobium]|uniref:hypothetical protein n=1 Tax=unclassified Mesorhizobium TaxID=325217 RepID=UPI001671B0AF|nr:MULTISPECIES: hypothetical protein [unclassified Mesorhizobium]
MLPLDLVQMGMGNLHFLVEPEQLGVGMTLACDGWHGARDQRGNSAGQDAAAAAPV